MATKPREQLKSGLHAMFVLGQRLGWDVLPRTFYSSTPVIYELRRKEAWKQPCSMCGIRGSDLESQVSFLRECCTPPLQERLRKGGIYEYACRVNNVPAGYGPTEADFLFCYIATKRPRKIVQIGCGVSTTVILVAARESGYTPQVVCIDPNPTPYLIRAAADHILELVPNPAEEVDLDLLTSLNAGDLLFVDSSHAVRPGGEVNRIILEVLPRLVAGCSVHFHDIYFPYDYQPSLLTNLVFREESTFLHAFLVGNERCAIAVSLSMLHHLRPAEMQAVLPNYRPAVTDRGLWMTRGSGHLPVSTYLSML
ncbi:MAG: class I SAM-dependent methyltransferase [Silvibacterium sp.]